MHRWHNTREAQLVVLLAVPYPPYFKKRNRHSFIATTHEFKRIHTLGAGQGGGAAPPYHVGSFSSSRLDIKLAGV